METGQHHNESASERCPCKHCRNPRRSQRCQLKWLDMHLRGTADDGLYVRRELMKLAKKLQYHVESDPASPDAVQRIVEEAEMGSQEESGSSATSTSQTPLTTCRLLQVMMEEHPEDLLSLTEDLLPHRHDLASRSYSKVEGKRFSRMRPQTPPTTRRTQQQKTSCKKRSRHQSGGPSSGLGQGVERGGAAAAGQDTSSSPPGAASLGTEGGVCTLGVWMTGHPNHGPHPLDQWQAGGGEGAEAQPGQGEGEGEGDGHSPAPAPATFPSLFHRLHWGRGFQQNAGHSYSEGSADEVEPEPPEAAPSSHLSHLPTSRPPSPAYSTLRLSNGEFDDSHPYTLLSPSSSRPTPSPSPAWLAHDTPTGQPAQPGPGGHTFVVSGTGPPSPPPAHPTCSPRPPGSPLAPDTNPGPGAWPRSQPLCPSPATLSYSPSPTTPSVLEAGPGPGPAPGPAPGPGPDPTSGLAPCTCQDQVARLSAHVARQDAQLAALRAELQQLQENAAAREAALRDELQKQQEEQAEAALAVTMLAIQAQGEMYRAGSAPQPGAPHRQSLTAMTRQPQRRVQQGSRRGQDTSLGPGTPSLAAQGSLNPPTLSTCRTLPQPHPGPGPA